jgi:pimeloyl-ACP methyl ester carboxylesterase
VGQFDLMGGSYGGWIAQSLVREHPDRVRKLVLSAIGPPNPENSRQLAKMLPLMRIMPTFVLKGMLSKSFSRLDTTQPQDPNMLLLWALAKEALYFHIGKADILALMTRLVDQTDHYTFTPGDLKDWPGQVLLLFGSDDPASPPEKREAMKALYPQAQVVVFQGQHAIALTHQDEYFAAIDGFLESDM